jgi:hypothetical protein
LSVARKLLKHGLPHLPHGLGWVLRGGATLGAAGAAGAALGAASYWAFRQWRKAPTLYEVETAHFQEEAGRQRAAHTSQPALSRNNAIGEHGVAPRSLRPGESANANQWPQPAQEGRGIAQGSILSPLYSNIYLHEFDLAITARGYRLVRYADDLLILCRSQREAYRALAQAEEVLAEMGLNFKPSKTRIAPLAEGFKFLGAELGANGRWKNLPGGEPGNPNGSLGQTNTHWLERARQSWLGRAVRTKPGIVQKGRAKKIK